MNGRQDVFSTDDYKHDEGGFTHAERIATLEAELRNTRIHDEDLKATLVKVTETMGELATATKVNATHLAQIRNELVEVKKKADFIPNTLMAAVIATAVTLGITSLSNASQSVKLASEVVETEQPTADVSQRVTEKEIEDGTGSN